MPFVKAPGKLLPYRSVPQPLEVFIHGDTIQEHGAACAAPAEAAGAQTE